MREFRNCVRCGKEFSITRKREQSRRFCGRACKIADEAVNGRPGAIVAEIDYTCEQCGKPFSYKPGYARAYFKKYGYYPKYCSSECFGVAKRKNDEHWMTNCIQCGKPMMRKKHEHGHFQGKRLLCSSECRAAYRRIDYQNKHPGQEVTRHKYKNGYIRVQVPGQNGEPSREILEHRYVMEQILGRRLLPEETVHHKNGNRSFNDPKNLELFSSRHGPGQRVIDQVRFAIEMIQLYPEFARELGLSQPICDAIAQITLPSEEADRVPQQESA